jgi:maltose/moltooligosaccharide transporter
MTTLTGAGMQGQKPQLTFWQIWNMCFGFLGIQFGFALQNGNVSRIFQTLGANMDDIPILWIAGPLTGLLVQPIIGYYSDRTWCRLGRRRPYFFYGAILTTLALFFMPNSPTLWIAAGMLWILDASINVTMEPFRAFVGDNLNQTQRPQGFAMQSFFIGVGAVVASALPYILSQWIGIDNTAAAGEIPDSVRYSFYVGGIVLLVAVLWTVLKSTEYSPAQLAAFDAAEAQAQQRSIAAEQPNDRTYWRSGIGWALVGSAAVAAVFGLALAKELYIISIGLVVFGLLQWWASFSKQRQQRHLLVDLIDDLFSMPRQMQHLAVVQFFSWFALFAMWIYTTAAVTSVHFGSSDPTSKAYNDGADWVGLLFAFYNGFAAIAALFIPWLVRKTSLALTHGFNLLCGAAGLAAFLLIKDASLLWVPMIGVGIAWASILSLPYAMLADSLPSHKMGVYMGMFNFFIVLPQLLAATVLGTLLRSFFDNQAIFALLLGAGSLVLAALYVVWSQWRRPH